MNAVTLTGRGAAGTAGVSQHATAAADPLAQLRATVIATATRLTPAGSQGQLLETLTEAFDAYALQTGAAAATADVEGAKSAIVSSHTISWGPVHQPYAGYDDFGSEALHAVRRRNDTTSRFAFRAGEIASNPEFSAVKMTLQQTVEHDQVLQTHLKLEGPPDDVRALLTALQPLAPHASLTV